MYVYLLRSKTQPSQRYVGLTSDLKKRLREHDAGKSPHTSKFTPWKLVVAVYFTDRHKAEAYTQTARKTPDADETVYEVLRIMDNFNLPLGSAEGPDSDPKLLKGMRSSTIWTIAADTKNLKYYYHTQHNRRLRMVDLKK